MLSISPPKIRYSLSFLVSHSATASSIDLPVNGLHDIPFEFERHVFHENQGRCRCFERAFQFVECRECGW